MSTHVHERAWYAYDSTTQTMRSWARLLTSPEEIPELFCQDFPAYSGNFPYTVLVPEERFSLWSKCPEQLLILLDEELLVLDASKKRIQTRRCPFADILLLEYGKILLYSWLTIAVPDGKLHVKFNSTNDRCFEPLLRRIRQGGNEIRPEQEQNGFSQEQFADFLPLMKVNYKYMNYGRQSVISGDRVLKFVYQPERRLRTVRFLKKVLFRQYASNHLSILTDRELILIREHRRRKRSIRNLYGAVFSYIPLRNIRGVSLSYAPENSHKTLEITLSDGTAQTMDFAHDHKEIDDFYQAVQTRTVEDGARSEIGA